MFASQRRGWKGKARPELQKKRASIYIKGGQIIQRHSVTSQVSVAVARVASRGEGRGGATHAVSRNRGVRGKGGVVRPCLLFCFLCASFNYMEVIREVVDHVVHFRSRGVEVLL